MYECTEEKDGFRKSQFWRYDVASGEVVNVGSESVNATLCLGWGATSQTNLVTQWHDMYLRACDGTFSWGESHVVTRRHTSSHVVTRRHT